MGTCSSLRIWTKSQFNADARMMRIAYLITAYDQPQHFGRLVRALAAEHSAFHVHVDQRVDIEPFKDAVQGTGKVRFVEHRIRVHWMGFSQVASILSLLKQATEDGFDYCVLLSGSDYPIKSNTHIRKFYEAATEEFLSFWKLQDRPSWKHKIEYFYPIDLISIQGWSKGTDPVYLRRLFWGRFHQYRHLIPKRRFPNGLEPYGGSDWWSLSQGCVRSILDFVAANPAYSRFYRFTHCPSEMFFQTIVLNSRWRERVRNYAAYQAWSESASLQDKAAETSMLPENDFNLRYIDWTGNHTHERETPAILDVRDWDAIRTSKDLFARKFRPGVSDSLMKRIDNELLPSASHVEITPAIST
jgi:hypothetical protein